MVGRAKVHGRVLLQKNNPVQPPFTWLTCQTLTQPPPVCLSHGLKLTLLLQLICKSKTAHSTDVNRGSHHNSPHIIAQRRNSKPS